MHVKQLISKKAEELKKSKEGYIGGFGRRKVKGRMMCLYYNLKKSSKKCQKVKQSKGNTKKVGEANKISMCS